MPCELTCVDPALVHRVWPLVRDMIHAAMRRGDIGAYAPVEQSVLAGRALLWLAIERETIAAAAVTELHQTEWRKVCVIVACGGRERSRWLHLIGRIEEFARAEGCAATRIVGRKGWARVLSTGGFETRPYRTRRIVLEKEI
jgi:hypothetical protein